MPKLLTLIAVLALSTRVLGHPSIPEQMRAALEAQSRVMAHALDACARSAEGKALQARAEARRAATAEALRDERGLKTTHVRRADKESFEKWSQVNHKSAEKYTLQTPVGTIFGSNTTCALVPETVIGPYYVEGELMRQDITYGEPGVKARLDFQFVDINTCEPVPGLLVDIWHANATGVYSGVATPGQGGLNTTYGRGVQQTDGDGVVQFDSIFPGHYEGRTTHIHVMSTDGADVLPNATFEGGTVRHIGQTYFDEELIQAVEAIEPYAQNKQRRTSNADDKLSADETTPKYDPFMKYVYLGDKPEDGLLAWITIGIDPDADYDDRTPAAHWYPGGGVDESDGAPDDDDDYDDDDDDDD